MGTKVSKTHVIATSSDESQILSQLRKCVNGSKRLLGLFFRLFAAGSKYEIRPDEQLAIWAVFGDRPEAIEAALGQVGGRSVGG